MSLTDVTPGTTLFDRLFVLQWFQPRKWFFSIILYGLEYQNIHSLLYKLLNIQYHRKGLLIEGTHCGIIGGPSLKVGGPSNYQGSQDYQKRKEITRCYKINQQKWEEFTRGEKRLLEVRRNVSRGERKLPEERRDFHR